jgi:hypothetical protein
MLILINFFVRKLVFLKIDIVDNISNYYLNIYLYTINNLIFINNINKYESSD